MLAAKGGLSGSTGPAAGLTDGDGGSMVVPQQPSKTATGETIMHELGHSVGLKPEDHDGIDSERYSESAYPSVMSYNTDAYQYSTGGAGANDFDDWEHIEQQLYIPATGRIDVLGYEPPG